MTRTLLNMILCLPFTLLFAFSELISAQGSASVDASNRYAYSVVGLWVTVLANWC